MATEGRPWFLSVLALLILSTGADAQRRGKGKAKAPPKASANKSEPKLPPIYLPGFDQPGKDTKTTPIGPKPKPTPSQATPEKPPDPMKEADQVTAAADHLTQADKARAQSLLDHFRLCDLDSGGWLSLREAEVTLSLDRSEYRRMDANQDGRLDATEFSAQGELLLARLGALPASTEAERKAQAEPLSEPEAEAPSPPAPPAPADPEPHQPGARSNASAPSALAVRPSDLLGRYDGDQSAGIDATEIERFFAEAGLALSPELVVAQMDPDDSGQLESPELVAIAWLASRHLPESLRPVPAPATPAEEPALAAAAPLAQPPARLALLSTHFGRLDPGHDGFIDEADLRALQSPSRLDLRFRALLSAMDQDGDGRLSEPEFRSSMGDGKR